MTPAYGDVGLDGNSIAILSRDGVLVFDTNGTPAAAGRRARRDPHADGSAGPLDRELALALVPLCQMMMLCRPLCQNPRC